MKSVKCSRCGLVNFADAVVCKRCNAHQQNFPDLISQPNGVNRGTAAVNSFDSYATTNQLPSNADSGAALKKMFFGALWAIGGTIATVIGYNSAGSGGKYMIFWGAILFGIIDFFVGVNSYICNKD